MGTGIKSANTRCEDCKTILSARQMVKISTLIPPVDLRILAHSFAVDPVVKTTGVDLKTFIFLGSDRILKELLQDRKGHR